MKRKPRSATPELVREDMIMMMELLYQAFQLFDPKSRVTNKEEKIVDYVGQMAKRIDSMKKYYEVD